MNLDKRLVLPAHSHLLQTMQELAIQKRIVLFAGLPGVGKSLYLQQLALLAQMAGRSVHLLQWDVARLAFEREPYSCDYPETAGSTHPIIRKAVGVWARQAVVDWANRADQKAMLIGEVPLVGGRLIELVVSNAADSAENILSASTTQFCIPVPSRHVRQHIEQARKRTIATPRNSREQYDAPPNVMYSTWYALNRAAVALGLSQNDAVTPAYDPNVYAAMYAHLLQHRHQQTLYIDQLLAPSGSVYDLDNIAGELQASEAQVAAIMLRAKAWDSAEMPRWY